MFVTIVQRHNAEIEQRDTYVLDEDEYAGMMKLPEADREQFVTDTGKNVDTTTTIEDIHETISVEVK